MVTFFVVLAWIIALLSLLGVSQATAGVAGICLACFMAIAARIAQASRHHEELLERLTTRSAQSPPPIVTEQNIGDVAKHYGVAQR